MNIQKELDKLLSVIKQYEQNHKTDPSDYLNYLSLFQNPAFRMFIDKSPQVVAVYNFPEQRYEFVSESSTKLYGVNPDQMSNDLGPRTFIEMLKPASMDLMINKVTPLMLEHCNKYASNITDLRFTACVEFNSFTEKECWVLMQSHILCASPEGFPILSCTFLTNVSTIKKDKDLHYSAFLSKNGLQEMLYCHRASPETRSLNISNREMEVLELLCQGKTSKEIAEKLFVSYETIKKHRSNILEKTACTNTAELVNFATTIGIL